MGSDPPVVVYDACVLYPFHLRNLLVQLAVEGVVAARWTDAIHDEWIDGLAAKRGVSRARLFRTRDLMKAILPEATVTDYRRFEAGLSLPDPDDRHVLAAAIAARASVLVTWNIRDFPAAELSKHGVIARDPDAFLSELYRRDPEILSAVVDAARANLRISEPSPRAFLGALEKQGLKAFVRRIRSEKSKR